MITAFELVQTIVGEDQVYPDLKLAIPGDSTSVKIAGVEVKDPTFGMDAIWIDRHKEAEAESNGYVVVEPESVLATHISQIMYKFAHELIGQDDVKVLLDNLAHTSPSLVESVVPKLVPLHALTGILSELLA
jgi:flagellar biosynthesis protein FlhA